MTITFSNGLDIVDVEARVPDLDAHVANYLSTATPWLSSPDTQRWSVRVTVCPTDAVFRCEGKLGQGEYAEPLLTTQTGSDRLIWNLSTGSNVRCRSEDHVVDICSPNLASAFVDTYRTVRQILVRLLLRRGAAVMHASAVGGIDGVTAFVGGKGAGKTTSVWHVLSGRPAQFAYIANERVLLLPVGDEILAYGWQGTAFVGLGTLMGSVGLSGLDGIHERCLGTARLLPAHKLIEPVYVRALTRSALPPEDASYKVFLTPFEVAHLAGSTVRAGGRLRRIVFPRFAADASSRVAPTPRADASEALGGEVIDCLPDFADWLGLGGSSPSRAEAGKVLRRAVDDCDLVSVEGARLDGWIGD